MAEQLTLDLPVRAARGREDFFVSPANAVALAQLDDWKNWPQNKLVLVGPKGAGKTHLAHVWATATGASIVPANQLVQTEIPDLSGAVVVEDADQIAGQPEAENALFHLHNLVLAEGGYLLLTARNAPHYWSTALPDLRSRMEATATATVNAPDDALLTALLIKLFSDRQLPVSAKLIAYLLPRIDRSFVAAADIVAKLDQAALASGRKISEKLAGELL
jgi:chromosomal replication initiation ATPase DnaA